MPPRNLKVCLADRVLLRVSELHASPLGREGLRRSLPRFD